MFFKKSQGAIEFLLILMFMLVIISFIMYIVGLYSIDLNNKEKKSEIDDYANGIVNQLYTFQKVEPGFTRTIIIPNYIMERYNVTINSSYLILQSLEYDNGNQKYYYYLPGSYQINYTYDNNTNTATLYFKKKSELENQYLYLK